MERALCVGAVISLTAGGTTAFEIREVLGRGGTCIAYRVHYAEPCGVRHEGVLKELCPAWLQTGAALRAPDGALLVPPSKRLLFDEALQEFADDYARVCAYLLRTPAAAAYHAAPIGMFTGNNTRYALFAPSYGESYDRLQDADLNGLFRLMHAVTVGVGMYHAAGLLHLDIKPGNILILGGVTEVVKVVDCDSLTALADLKKGTVRFLPMPEDYYVPELFAGRQREVDCRTDIFEIGAMTFLRLFGRAPAVPEMSAGARYDFSEAPLLAGASEETVKETAALLARTVQIARCRRYPDTGALAAHFRRLIALTRPLGAENTENRRNGQDG